MNKDNRWTTVVWNKMKSMGWRKVFDVIKPSFSSCVVFIVFILLVIFFPSQQWGKIGDNINEERNNVVSSTTIDPSPTMEKKNIENYPSDIDGNEDSSSLQENDHSQHIITTSQNALTEDTTLSQKDSGGNDDNQDHRNTSSSEHSTSTVEETTTSQETITRNNILKENEPTLVEKKTDEEPRPSENFSDTQNTDIMKQEPSVVMR